MFGIGFLKPYKETIVTQNRIIKELREKVESHGRLAHDKSLEVTRLAAENAVLKQQVIKLESEVQSHLTQAERVNRVYTQTGMIIFNDKEFIEKNTTISVPNSSHDSNHKDFNDGVAEAGKEFMVAFSGLLDPKEEKPPINEKLQAYYNRGKNKTTKKRKPKNNKK